MLSPFSNILPRRGNKNKKGKINKQFQRLIVHSIENRSKFVKHYKGIVHVIHCKMLVLFENHCQVDSQITRFSLLCLDLQMRKKPHGKSRDFCAIYVAEDRL